MFKCVSTFKSSEFNDKSKHSSVVLEDLGLQTSTFGISNNFDDCNQYSKFLDELDEIHAKVISGDFTDFTEL